MRNFTRFLASRDVLKQKNLYNIRQAKALLEPTGRKAIARPAVKKESSVFPRDMSDSLPPYVSQDPMTPGLIDMERKMAAYLRKKDEVAAGAKEKVPKTDEAGADNSFGAPDGESSKAVGIFERVEIVDRRGSPLGEIDGININEGLFIEDKSAKGLNIINPRTGLPQQTAQEWADKQIFAKTRDRIKALEEGAVATRATKNGTPDVPEISELKNLKKFEFRIDADTPELRQAVMHSIERLGAKYSNHKFNAKFGGEN